MTQEKEQSSRDKKIMKMVDEDNFLTKESELNFNCNACGKCCFNQDIILTTLDILRLRREFEVPTSGILDMFCQVHRGPNSQLPVMLLKFKPLDSGVTACPFLKANEGNQKASCSIHQNSPEVCKLYPLGRGFIHDIKTKKHEVKYFCMDKADLACDKDCFSCKNTVGDYLNKNSVVDSGKYQEQYNKLMDILKLNKSLFVHLFDRPTFNFEDIKLEGDSYTITRKAQKLYGVKSNLGEYKQVNKGKRNPKTVLEYSIIQSGKEYVGHPTQKPIELLKYLITASTNKEDTVLDCFLGSGSSAIACKQLGRNFIGFEISPEYCKIANKRLAQEVLI